MQNRYVVFLFCVIVFLFGNLAYAQEMQPPTEAPPIVTPVPVPVTTNAWNVSVNGGYSNIQQAGTNNGFFFSTAIHVAEYWNIRGDVFVMNDPAVTLSLIKPEYRIPSSRLFKNASGNYFATNNVEFFLNGGIGNAHYTDPAKGSTSKFAWGIGGGFDMTVLQTGGTTVTIRPLDVNYISSQLIGGGKVIGNHLQFAAGLGLRF